MEVSIQINKAKEIIEKEYKDYLLENDRRGKKRLIIDYDVVSMYEPEIAHLLIDEAETTIKAFEIATEQFDLCNNQRIKIRIKNAFKNTYIPIGQVRAERLDKLITISGIIKARTPVKFKIQSVRFECPNCGHIINVLQVDKNFKEPTKCACGRKGTFRILSKEVINGFSLVIEENIDESESPELAKISVLVQEDLTDYEMEKRLQRGVRVKVTGILKSFMKYINGKASTELDHYIEANYIDVGEDINDINITPEDIEKITQYSRDELFLKKATCCLMKDIYGYEEEKETIVLQAFGGTTKYKDGTVQKRGSIHCLVIGEPGLSKSFMLQLAKSFLPKYYFFIAGKRTTGAGLFCGVIKDELLGVYSIEAGAMPLAHKGICLIDEFDKLDTTYRSDIHGPMEQQVYTNTQIVKATLKTECGILAAANPKDNKFSDYYDIIKSIDLPLTLLNRFDYIYPIKDIVDEKDDYNKAVKILCYGESDDQGEPYITPLMFKKFVLYAQKFQPSFSKDLIKYIAKKYVTLRRVANGKSMLISPRQLEAIKRTAEAKAKTRLSNDINFQDVEFAFNKIYYSIKKLLNVDVTTDIQHLDISTIELGQTLSNKSRLERVFLIIANYNKEQKQSCDFDFIKIEAEKSHIDEIDLDKCIALLKRDGDIFEPKPGRYSVTK